MVQKLAKPQHVLYSISVLNIASDFLNKREREREWERERRPRERPRPRPTEDLILLLLFRNWNQDNDIYY